MRQILATALLLFTLMLGAACGAETAPGDTTAAVVSEPADVASTTAFGDDGLSAEDIAALETAAAEFAAAELAPVTVGCEDYLRFCVTATTSGTVEATATAGTNIPGVNGKTCAEWAVGEAARVFDLPFMVQSGDSSLTVALTSVGTYAGPGQYELKPTTQQGLPDTFPTIDVAGRAFSNGEGATATVVVNPDGSGSITAAGLVEITSLSNSSPDPNAQIDFSMEWTCRDL